MEDIKNKIATINKQLDFFTEEEQKNFCEDCLKDKGDLTEYDAYLTDTGTCHECGKVDDLVNVKIAKLILENDISITDYHINGGDRIYPEKRM